MGIPAFLFFVAAVGMALKGTYQVYRKTRGDPRLEEMGNVALGFHYCMVVYAVTILFEHIAYSIMLPVFGGMAACLVRTAEAEIQRIQSIPLPVMMSPTMFHTLSGQASGTRTGGLTCATSPRYEPDRGLGGETRRMAGSCHRRHWRAGVRPAGRAHASLVRRDPHDSDRQAPPRIGYTGSVRRWRGRHAARVLPRGARHGRAWDGMIPWPSGCPVSLGTRCSPSACFASFPARGLPCTA